VKYSALSSGESLSQCSEVLNLSFSDGNFVMSHSVSCCYCSVFILAG